MIELNVENLRNHLKSQNWDPQMQEETGQLYLLFKFQDIEYVMFFRIYEKEDFLQMLLFLPSKIKEGCENDLARLLHRINQGIDMPGYGMNEDARAIFYRIMLPTVDGQLEEKHIDAILNSLEGLCKMFSVAIIGVAQGKITYEKLISEVKNATPSDAKQ